MLIGGGIISSNIDTSLGRGSGSNHINGFLWGGGIILAGAAIGRFMYPNDDDFYNFINIHNKYNSKYKMEIKSIVYDPVNNKTVPGFALVIQF